VSIEFWLRLEPQIRPTRFGINLLFITVKAERKVRLCVKLSDFFLRWILIRLTSNLSRFVPNSVNILTWNFRKKNYFGRIFTKFCANQDYPLPKHLKFLPTFCNFIQGSYCVQKNHTSTFQCCLHPGKETFPWINHKKKIWGRKAETFCFRKTNFVHSRSGTYYALLLGCFSLRFLLDICHCVFRVLAETWPPNSSQKICNKCFIHHCQGWKEGSFVCETVDFFPRWILIRLTGNLSRFVPSFVEILTCNLRKKTISGEFLRNFVQTKPILYQNFWNFVILSAILLWVRIALKNSHKYIHMVFAPK